jgi:hypothetical protein
MFVLGMVMAVSLLVTLVAGTIAIILFGQPLGDSARMVGATFAWLFAGAFLVTFFLVLAEEIQRGKAREHAPDSGRHAGA